MKTLKIIQFVVMMILVAQTSFANTVFVEGHTLNPKEIDQNKVILKKLYPKVSEQTRTRFAEYLTSIGLVPSVPYYKKEMERILEGATQFVFCSDLEDWSCLELQSPLYPQNKNRQDAFGGLGQPRRAGESLNIEYYFTYGWYNNFIRRQKNPNADYVIPEKTVAKVLAQKIQENGQKNIWMALYGIDDIQGTMAPVYNAIKDKFESGTDIRAVVDVSDDQGPNSFIRDYDIRKLQSGKYLLDIQDQSLDYSYVESENAVRSAFSSPDWMQQFMQDISQKQKTMKPTKVKEYVLSEMFVPPSEEIQKNKTLLNKYKLRILDLAWLAMNVNLDNYKEEMARATFEYGNTLQLIKLLNSKAHSNQESRAHLEFPFKSIMHNKFFVFENTNGEKSLWSGTANVAKTCMGSEENANLSIFIKNEEIANTFIEEFNEMFTPVIGKSTLKPDSLSTGLFHDKKKPNTQRYFVFDDKTEVRVHFSPTDDGEHRVLLPLIYSARAGDILRISMFGAGGYEYVRAMQAAAARGVDVRIVLDAFTGSGVSSWFQDIDANIYQVNNFTIGEPTGKIEVRLSDWKGGLNHHKTGTLTRKLSDGEYFPEVIVVGSQNWSQSGNDSNDENMMVIRNKTKVLDITAAFNKEFDEKLWPSSSEPMQSVD